MTSKQNAQCMAGILRGFQAFFLVSIFLPPKRVDSLMRDVKMAQDAGVIDIHAKYGTAVDTEAYQVLRRVTHWTKEDVEREKKVLAEWAIKPTHVLENSLQEILSIFDFIPHQS